jgi:predicted Rossmann fold nucleotide-binding protein DprA/Smf involved in DNA uptake
MGWVRFIRGAMRLARQIIDNGGTLVSEFPLITPPLPAHFPDATGLSAA